MAERMVQCLKLGKELPGLEKPPFSGEVGKKIYDQISAEGWNMWKEMQIKILNEYRLNMSDPADYQKLVDQMMSFLSLNEGTVLDVENAERGRSGS